MSGKGDAKTADVAAKVITEVASGNAHLKHVSAPAGGLSQAEKEAYLAEKAEKK